MVTNATILLLHYAFPRSGDSNPLSSTKRSSPPTTENLITDRQYDDVSLELHSGHRPTPDTLVVLVHVGRDLKIGQTRQSQRRSCRINNVFKGVKLTASR